MGRLSIFRCALFALCVTALIPTGAVAQTPTFALEGVVTDAQQAVLPGVTVTVHNTATGLTRVVTTGDGGRFVVRALPPEGRYRIQVELAGFASEVREGLRFNAGQNGVLNFTMKLSTVQETITVAGDAPVVQTTSSEVASTIVESGCVPAYSSPEQLAATMTSDVPHFGNLVKAAGITPQ